MHHLYYHEVSIPVSLDLPRANVISTFAETDMRNVAPIAVMLFLAGCASTVDMADSEPSTHQPTKGSTAENTAPDTPHVNIPTVPINKVDKPPRHISGPAPDYTFEMIQNKVEGIVTAQLLIGRSGAVKDVVILEHLGHGTEKATRDALMQYMFEPAMKDGKPVAVWIEMSVNFRPMRR